MEKYKQAYGVLPSKTPADAGYGSYDNYKYCKENNIELYMKYSGYYKEKEKTTEKHKFQSVQDQRKGEQLPVVKNWKHFMKKSKGMYKVKKG